MQVCVFFWFQRRLSQGNDQPSDCRRSPADGYMRATVIMIDGKGTVIPGYGDVSKGSAFAMRRADAHALMAELDPFCALHAKHYSRKHQQ